MNLLHAASDKKKRLKVELTIPQKWEIIEYSKKFPNVKQKSMILKFNKEFNTTIPSSTMSDILKPDNIRKLEKLDNVDDFNKRIREAKYPDLDKCLYLWYSEQVRNHIPVSDDMLREEAIEFGKMLGLVTFNYSKGYIHRFKQRFSIKQYKIKGESASVSMQCLEK
jgi:hypothetical protein